MTIGTATVARTKVRGTGPRCASQGPSARLRTVRVGKTVSQIMRASWCLVGGPTWVGCFDMRGTPEWLGSVKDARPGDRDADVFLDEVVVDGDGGDGALARGADHLRTWVDDVPRRPDTGDAGASRGV